MPIDAKKDSPTPFGTVVRCADCHLGVVTPLPDADEIAELYRLDRYYTHGSGHMREIPPKLHDRLLIKAAWWRDNGEALPKERIAAILPADARICDLGCGGANYLRWFKAKGFDVLGVDPDAEARRHAGEAGVTALEGTAEGMPAELEGESFDFVIMTHSLEHCRNPVKALENAYALTRPGGFFYCEVPNSQCRHFQQFTICSEMFDVPRHLYFFRPQTLRTMVEHSGFSVKSEHYSGFLRQHVPSWRDWESAIYERVKRHDPTVAARRHDFLSSVRLFLRTAWAAPENKYDCVGVLAQRSDD
jgi:SAM-dependent methyltransferase